MEKWQHKQTLTKKILFLIDSSDDESTIKITITLEEVNLPSANVTIANTIS